MIAADSALVSALIGALATVAVGFGVYLLTARSSTQKQRREARTSAYISMLVVVDHVLASADAAAPMEGDFGSLREEFEMTPAERARVRAEVRAHGTAAVRDDFTDLVSKYEQLQKLAMHIWDLHDRSQLEGFPVSDEYGLSGLEDLRAEIRTIAVRLEETVRSELHG